MEIGIIIDLDGINDFKVPDKEVPDNFSVAIFSADKTKALKVSSQFNSDKVVVVASNDKEYIMEVIEDSLHVDKIFLVSHRINSKYSVPSLGGIL